MEQQLVQYFMQYEALAMWISMLINIVVAVLGIVPSVFVTGANLIFFGFYQGTFISFLGEAIGAMIAFYLYRKGLKKVSQPTLSKYPRVKRLLEAEGREAFLLILSLRMLPFIPSGLVTFSGAIGKVSLPVFTLASSLGKIPALLLEAYSVYQITRFDWPGKILLALSALYLLYLVWKKVDRNTSS